MSANADLETIWSNNSTEASQIYKSNYKFLPQDDQIRYVLLHILFNFIIPNK